MRKQTTCYGCDKPTEPEWLPEGEFIVCDECSSDTDELSVEKLQEQLNTAKNELTEISELSDPLDNDTLMSVVANVAGEALAAIGKEWSGNE